MTSFSASDRRSNDRVVRVRGLNALNAILSVPKKACMACTIALLAQLCADGWSRKHLENVYAKLGVQTRTAAVARLLAEEPTS